ncbi:MAG: hypothetical protein NC399_09750 [Muribaculum sp.]|nr:hypothetical protein [Muribaculum sp.]
MRDDVGEAWDGFDGSPHLYNERKEKRWQKSVWRVLACLMGLMILYQIRDQAEENRLMRQGAVIEAEYDSQSRTARFRDDTGRYHIVNLSGYYPAHEGSRIRLYYERDAGTARPRNALAAKLFCYCFFGGILGFCLWRIGRVR